MKKLYSILFVIIIAVLAGCGKEQNETKVNVFVAASLSNAMDEIKAEYERENPETNIIYNADSSGTLEKQIEEGADCDIFLSAAEDKMALLDEKGYLQENSIHKLLANQLVIIKQKNTKTNVTGFNDIYMAKNMALASEDVPAGAYAREIFQTLGINDKIAGMEINEGSNVTEVLAAVSEGSNEVGIVYETDAMSMKDSVEVIAVAEDSWLKTPVVYPVACVNNRNADCNEKDAAEDFLKYLLSEDAKKIFENYGFQIVDEE